MGLFDLFEKPKPVGPGEYWGSDYLEHARTLYERGDFKRAYAKAVRAIDAWPLAAEGYVIAGDALQRIERDNVGRITEGVQDEDTPEGFYKSALLHEPDDELRVKILHRLGAIYAEQGDHARAADAYEEATMYGDEPESWYGLAYSRSIDTGELQTAPLLNAFERDPEKVTKGLNDPKWEPFLEELTGLVAAMRVLITAKAEETYRLTVKAIDEAEAVWYASGAHREYA